MASSFWRPAPIFTSAILLRVGLFFWGLYQDTHSPVKYTDVDYVVFTDASRYVSNTQSPYDRDTYRYTPILAWMLLPTAWAGWFSFGKFLFAVSDIVTGELIVRVLRKQGLSKERALKYASIWLLNPMVATISTRGSSEGLLAMIVVALLWAVMSKRIVVAGVLLGLGVHFKIYPFIYAPGIVWWLDDEHLGKARTKTTTLVDKVKAMCSPERITLAVAGLATFMALNGAMYYMWVVSFSIFGTVTDTKTGMAFHFCNIPIFTMLRVSIIVTISLLTTSCSISAQHLRCHPRFIWSLLHSSRRCCSRASSYLFCWLRRICLLRCWHKRLPSSHSTRCARVKYVIEPPDYVLQL